MWRPVNDLGDEVPKSGRVQSERVAFAILDRVRIVALAQTMPDAQSAILLCLLWQAARQERLTHGPNAGEAVARLSGGELAEMTGRPLRTIRYALSRLKGAGWIAPNHNEPGKKAVYRLEFIQKKK